MTNFVIAGFIALWAGVVVFSVVKKRRQAKKTGTPTCCCGCKSLKEGNCSNSCIKS